MADYVVSPTGNDTTGDGSEGTPFATVDHVHDNVAVNGDRCIVRGTLQQEVNLTRTFASGARFTVTQHDDGGWINGNWTLPATGAIPKTGPDGDVHLGPLVNITGRYITWEVNIQKSLGRNLGISGQDITIQKPSNSLYPFLYLEWARNAGFNASGAANIIGNDICVMYSGCFYQSIRNPDEKSGGTNWPVAFNTVGVETAVFTRCWSYHNWGEGFSAGRGSVVSDITFQDGGCVDNMSVNWYANRSDTVYCLRNLIMATGTASGFNRSSGIALRNENNPGTTTPLRTVWIAHNLVIGNHNNLLIATNQEEGDTIEDIFVYCNSFVNARLGSNGSTFSNLRLAAGDRTGIIISRNAFHQDSGPITNVGNLTGYTFSRNYWGGGGGSPASGVISGTDVTGFAMQSPNAGYAVIKDGNGRFLGTTVDYDNYRPTAAHAQTSVSGIGTTDLEGSTRVFWMSALEYGGTGSGDPDPDPPPPPTGTADIAIARVACNTSAGDQDISLSGLSEAPNLFYFIVGNTTADNTPSAGAALSHGWAATGSGQWADGKSVEDAESPSNAARFSVTDGCVILPRHTGNIIDGKAAYVSATSTSVKINWSTAPPSGFLLTVIALVVPDAYVASPLQSATNGGYVTVTPGFTPDVIHADINGRPWPNETGNQSWHHSVGLASYDGATITQKAIITDAVDNISANESIGHIREDYIGGFVNTSGNLVWAAEISDITATDFRLYTREGTPAPQSQVGIVAFSLGGLGAYVGLQQSPASAVTPPDDPVDHSWTGFGFQPKFVLAFNSLMSVLGSTVTTGDAGAYGVSAILAGAQQSMAWAWEDSASGDSDTQTLFDDKAINLPQHDGTDGQEAAFSSFDASGITFSFTKALATARYSLVLAIQQSTSISLDDFTATPTSGDSPLDVDFEADVTVVGTTVDHYEWDFGDGNTASTSGNTTSHTYTTTNESGESWTVGVTVVAANDDESYLAKADYITATYVPPPPPSEPEEVNLFVFAGAGSNMKANGIPAAGGTLG